MENSREQLVLDAASELPFVLVKELLRNIRENAEIEQDKRMLTVALQKMKRYANEYETENNKEKEAVVRFIEYVSGKTNSKHTMISYNLSDSLQVAKGLIW